MIPRDGHIVLVGCGKMGGAMLTGWLERGLSPGQVLVQEPHPSDEIADQLARTGIRRVDQIDASDVTAPPTVVVMAVKPQVMDDVFASVVPRLGSDTVVLSIAAGRTIASFEALSGPSTPVVRSIPNTPAAIGRGITVCAGNSQVNDHHRDLCDTLLSALGDVAWVDQEALIDAATAVSGSGPAYVFLLAECLADAARAVGLKSDLAKQLADATVSGAGELLRQSDLPAETLRRNVTSPNGTTQAALDVLMADDGMKPLLTSAVRAAQKRSEELSR
ncbi:MAG: pyrroline-5-carboxylate reductase [Pseudomonadota bacterium]